MSASSTSTCSRTPFTVIDQAVHLLDTPAEPWGIQFELAGLGRLDVARLRAAVAEAVTRHPMARARQLPARWTDRTWEWEITPAPDLDPVRVVEGDADDVYSRQICLAEAPPFRLVVSRRPSGDSLLLHANHAAFDGFGCLRLLQSVARAYAGDPDPDAPLDDARDVMHLLAAPDPGARRRRLRLLASKVGDLVVRTSRLAPDGGSDRPGYGFHRVAVDPPDPPGDATLNDVLLAALTLAITRWNEDHGRSARRIGILVPVNLRPKEWSQDVVTNMVLDARVVTTEHQPDAVLADIRSQMETIKAGGGSALIEALGALPSLPLWAKAPASPLLWLTGNRLVCTALLSNMGDLDEPPDFGPGVGRPTGAWFSAPGRMPCGLTVGVVGFDDQLFLSFRYRYPLFDASAAQRFADLFCEELEKCAKRS